jgi:uncharacterized membrane protein YqjE
MRRRKFKRSDSASGALEGQRAQILSFDLMFAIVILLVIVGAMTLVLLQYAAFEEQQAQNRDIEIKTQAALNSLLLTPGIPADWENITNTTPP